MATPAELLKGHIIDGWTVEDQLGVYPGMTGGHFSTGYIVSKDGRKAFLKAMDLHSAKGIDDINRLTQQFTFERELLNFCGDRRLSHVVKLIHNGEHQFGGLPPGMPPMFNAVYYMVFEWSDGDIRREITFTGSKPSSWKLHVLHQAAVGLQQLHGASVAHQDLKPSNVLGFEQSAVYKIGDLGRSTARHLAAPTDVLPFPGDYSYAPPEYQYGYSPPDYHDRRLGSDVYLLGSLMSFLFINTGAIVHTLYYVPGPYQPEVWVGAYPDVLPFIESAHTKATEQFKTGLPDSVRDELGSIYFQLCHPNPSTRGHPRARQQAGRPLGLDRYISAFALLKKKLEIEERRRRQNAQ